MRLRVFGIVIAAERALLRFGNPLLEWLAHFQRHELRELFFPIAKNRCGLFHRPRAVGKRSLAPRLPGFVRLGDGRGGLLRRHFVVGLKRFTSCGVYSVECHGSPENRHLTPAVYARNQSIIRHLDEYAGFGEHQRALQMQLSCVLGGTYS
jgi:hypothetical protein